MRHFARHLSPRWRPALKSAALALVLIAAEAFAFGHAFDLDAHATDEPCKICIKVAGLAAGAAGKPAPVTVDTTGPLPIIAAFLPTGRTRLVTSFARGPPHAS
jgi:hypothetical protein